jgi:hypothetical protein
MSSLVEITELTSTLTICKIDKTVLRTLCMIATPLLEVGQQNRKMGVRITLGHVSPVVSRIGLLAHERLGSQ